MQPKNEITTETRDAATLLRIKGDVTVFSEPFLKEAYLGATRQGANRILLVFDKESYINSGGIAVLIQILAEARKRSQVVGITGLSEHFKKIFNMVGITKFAKIYGSVEEGLSAMASAG